SRISVQSRDGCGLIQGRDRPDFDRCVEQDRQAGGWERAVLGTLEPRTKNKEQKTRTENREPRTENRELRVTLSPCHLVTLSGATGQFIFRESSERSTRWDGCEHGMKQSFRL